MMLVDGPPGMIAPGIRYPAVPRMLPRMAGECHVFFDDAQRPEEQEVLRRWISESGLTTADGGSEAPEGQKLVHLKYVRP